MKDNSLVTTPMSLQDVNGRLLQEMLIKGREPPIDLSVLPTGNYFVWLADGTSLKILKQ